jgi:outer membrane protein
MTRTLFRTLIPASLLAGSAVMMAPQIAHAQEVPVGLSAGTILVRVRALDVAPLDSSSSISTIGGSVHVTDQFAPEVDGSYFFTDNIAVEAIAASTRHVIQARGTALGTVDVGSTYVLPPAVTWQYNFFPHQQLSPYLGAGADLSFFYDESTGSAAVTKLDLRTAAGPVLEAGVDYNITGRWFLNVDVKEIFESPNARIDTSLGVNLKAKVALNPLVAGIGVGYAF